MRVVTAISFLKRCFFSQKQAGTFFEYPNFWWLRTFCGGSNGPRLMAQVFVGGTDDFPRRVRRQPRRLQSGRRR
jgi:hypothetical protein